LLTRRVPDLLCGSTIEGIIAHVGAQAPRKNSGSHIDASHSRQPLVKGERLVRYEVNAVMVWWGGHARHASARDSAMLFLGKPRAKQTTSSLLSWLVFVCSAPAMLNVTLC